MSSTCAPEELRRFSEPAQPLTPRHSVSAYGAASLLASSAKLGSPTIAFSRSSHAPAPAPRGTSTNGSVPFVHVKSRNAPVSSSTPASHAARLIDIVAPYGVTPVTPESRALHA
jgi:hypothetical protein